MTDLPGFPWHLIRLDGAGRASLTDMHRIAGGGNRNQPAEWLKRKTTRALLARENAKRDSRFEETTGPGAKVCEESTLSEPVRVVRGGNAAGTWAAPAIAREYALFLAPRFHPWREWRGRPDLLAKVMDPRFWPEWPGDQKKSDRNPRNPRNLGNPV